jgi:hypothetical protein
MHHTERKSFILPSGRTLSQTWGALRRSWLGFKIAKSNGDLQRMKYYVEGILKLQTELGVTLTKFDSDLVEFQSNPIQNFDTNESEVPEVPIEYGDELRSSEIEETNEKELDYDNLLPRIPATHSDPGPRQEIFNRYVERKEKSYLFGETGDEEDKVVRRKIHYLKSCPSRSAPSEQNEMPINIETRNFYSDRSEPFHPTNIGRRDASNVGYWDSSSSAISSDFYEFDPNRINKGKKQQQRKKKRSNNSCYYESHKKSCFYKDIT